MIPLISSLMITLMQKLFNNGKVVVSKSWELEQKHSLIWSISKYL